MIKRKKHSALDPTFRLIDLEQDSQEWLEWRHTVLGASDASTLLGINKFKDPLTFVQEKLSPELPVFETNEHIERGKALEPEARELLETIVGYKFEPKCMVSKDYPIISASLDGINFEEEVICEIKCPKSLWYTKKHGIPDYYKAQMNQQLFVSGMETCIFFAYANNDYYMEDYTPQDSVIEEQVSVAIELMDLVFKLRERLRQDHFKSN